MLIEHLGGGKRMSKFYPAAVAVIGISVGIVTVVGAAEPVKTEPQTLLTPDQARREVRLLDDLYKTTIVLMNNTYVKDSNNTAAAEVARDTFAAMQKNKWHEAHWLDATGKPMNADNAPRDDFEKQAIKRLLKGEKYCDEIVGEGDHKYLRAATVVPVVNNSCLNCHPGHKVGDVLGGISYKIPVQ